MTLKYHNKPFKDADGLRWHSRGEYARWQELKLLERAGVISQLDRQSPFALHAPMLQRTPHVGGLAYLGKFVADFVYTESGEKIVEDWKGYIPAFSQWKMAHFEAEYGIKIRITGPAAKRKAA